MRWAEKTPMARRQRTRWSRGREVRMHALGWVGRRMAHCGERAEPIEQGEPLCVFSSLTRPWSSASKLRNPEGRAGLPLGLGGGLGTRRVGGRPAGWQVSGEAQAGRRPAFQPDRLCPRGLLRPQESLGWAHSHLPSHSSRSTWPATSSLRWAPALAPSTLPLPAPHSHRTCWNTPFPSCSWGRVGPEPRIEQIRGRLLPQWAFQAERCLRRVPGFLTHLETGPKPPNPLHTAAAGAKGWAETPPPNPTITVS